MFPCRILHFPFIYFFLNKDFRYNILFLLAGGGKFNFQGTKKWIEDNVESAEISLLAEADYVLCIDAIGNGENLKLHVSKPPKEGTQGYLLIQVKLNVKPSAKLVLF